MVRFLVIRFSSIGDIILTTPVLRHLKQQVEDCEIHYLTKSTYATLLEANPYIDRIHSFDGDIKSCIAALRHLEIDYVIDLHRNFRTARIKQGLKRIDFSVHKLNVRKWLLVNLKKNLLPDRHMVDRNLDTIKTFIEERDKQGLDYFIPEAHEVSVDSLPETFKKGYVALAIGAQHETKKLTPELLIRLCQKLEYPLLILGGPEDRKTGEIIISSLPDKTIVNACGSYSIHQSASLVRQSRLLITHDTGLMHIGAAFQKKIISVWGNTIPRFGMYPYRAHPSSVPFEVQGLPCRPCSKIGFHKCPKKHFNCMQKQDLDAIADKAGQLWHSSS
ncbi:MAG: glycosyltransferase family 9 protein [Bacteroidales bacterium]|nr:glycosyltransferase family 9 protein [Bacteroidales bacterium]